MSDIILNKTIAVIKYKIGAFRDVKHSFFIYKYKIYEHLGYNEERLIIGYDHVSNVKKPFNKNQLQSIYYIAVIGDKKYGIPFKCYHYLRAHETYSGSLIEVLKTPKIKDTVSFNGMNGTIVEIVNKKFVVLADKEYTLKRHQFSLAKESLILFEPDE